MRTTQKWIMGLLFFSFGAVTLFILMEDKKMYMSFISLIIGAVMMLEADSKRLYSQNKSRSKDK